MTFKKPYNDTCSTFHRQQNLIKANDCEVSKAEKEQHLKDVSLAYDGKKEDNANANEDFYVGSFDLQKCLPTPRLSTSEYFYKRKLWTFNLTVRVDKKKPIFMFSQIALDSEFVRLITFLES